MGIADLLKSVPLKYRQIAYTLLTLFSIVYGAWQASDGDWKQVGASLLTALVTGMARVNATDPDAVDGTEPDPEDIDGETFDETAGGEEVSENVQAVLDAGTPVEDPGIQRPWLQ